MKKNLGNRGVMSLALTFVLSACSSSPSEQLSSEELSGAATKACQAASEEDLNNINEGMISSKYMAESGFVADFNAGDVDAIRQVFPSYVSPKVIAAAIKGSDGDSVIGLWGIQKFDYGWRITALNKQTQEYSNLGADLAQGSATARVNAQMLELSVNTNVISCLKN